MTAPDNPITHHLPVDETLYRSVIDAMGEGVVVYDKQGAIIAWNAATERILGFSPDALRARTVHDPRLPTFREDGTPVTGPEFPVLSTLATGLAHHDQLFRVQSVHGDRKWLLVSTHAIRQPDEAPPYAVVATFADVTDQQMAEDLRRGAAEAQQRLEQSLREAKEAAEAASRAKSDFLARMSHELRTPLNSVIGFTNALAKNKDGRLVPQELTYLERIRANGMHLLQLITDILDLSKIEAGRMVLDVTRVDIVSTVRHAVAQFEPQAREQGVSLHTSIPTEPLIISIDEGKLLQVLLNLVSNALKFTEQGEVTVTVSHRPGATQPIEIEVRDTGIGIAPERQQAIFEPFEQAESSTTRKYGGTGLGLAISRSLCELMGATLSMESTPGEGSTFRMSFFGTPLATPFDA